MSITAVIATNNSNCLTFILKCPIQFVFTLCLYCFYCLYQFKITSRQKLFEWIESKQKVLLIDGLIMFINFSFGKLSRGWVRSRLQVAVSCNPVVVYSAVVIIVVVVIFLVNHCSAMFSFSGHCILSVSEITFCAGCCIGSNVQISILQVQFYFCFV